MARFIICEKCKKFVKYDPETVYEGGMSYTTLVCPKCGYVKRNSVNHVHYGQDGKH